MITVTFQCENHNHAILLATLFDVLTVPDIDDSILMMENTDWLLEEVCARLEEVDQWDVREGEHALKGFPLQVAEMWKSRHPNG